MRRRQFMALVAGAATSRSLVARAQSAAMPVIGFVSGASAAGIPFATSAFRQGLRETGYVEGQNVAIEYRWADNQLDRLPAMIADLVHRQVSVIVAGGTRRHWQLSQGPRPSPSSLKCPPTRSS